jgi:hypothetical protein
MDESDRFSIKSSPVGEPGPTDKEFGNNMLASVMFSPPVCLS